MHEDVGRRSRAVIWALAVCLAVATSVGAQTRPLQTEEATTAPSGTLLFATGFGTIAAEPSFITGAERTRWDGPLLRLVYSPSDAIELDLEWVAVVGAGATPEAPAAWDTGDVTVRTKLRLVKGHPRRPTLSARFGVVLPQTSYQDENGPLALGPDTLRFYIEALATQAVGAVRLDLNAGLFLFDDPMRLRGQIDFLSYGLAGRWAVRPTCEVVAEVAGRSGQGKPGADERAEARLGVRYLWRHLRFDAAVRRGLISTQGTWGVTAGVTWTIRPSSSESMRRDTGEGA